MGWFDILKLGGEDFGTPQINQDSHYGDKLSEKENFFHNLKDVATTRPHFEYSAKSKYKDIIQGNLREIRQKLEGQSLKSNSGDNATPYMAFSAPNSKYLVSFRKIEPDKNYTGSINPSEILDHRGSPRPARPFDLKNTKSVILFDSVYDGYDVARLRKVFNNEPLNWLIPIWGEGDKGRLSAMMRKKDQANPQELINNIPKLKQNKEELEAEQKKLQKNLDKMPTFSVMPPWLSEQKKRTEDRILVIDSEIDKIDDELKEIGELTQRSKGKTSPPRRRRGRRRR